MKQLISVINEDPKYQESQNISNHNVQGKIKLLIFCNKKDTNCWM